MSLPTDSEYQEAVQNPSQVFSDPDLKSGQPELTSPALPFPKARSGNFATVYRLNCGTQSWAVRCFTRSIHPDQKRRYAEISRHLEGTKLRYAVGFTLIEKGIQVRGQWLPILKMEWLNGESLGSHIERNLRSPKALLALATKWVEMTRALRQSGIAHGDLQHGNVLIVGGELRLIDYDGMFVPSLAGSTSYERGHDNYQHPKRGDLFGPDLDNFSAWVVLISILALASQPQLWDQFKGGDDCLLFRKRDFSEPEKSKVLLALLNSREQSVRSLTALFKTLLSLPAGQVPPLDGNLLQTAPPTSQSSAIPSWVGDHKSAHAPRLPTAPSSQTPADAPASWVLDFVEPPTKASAQFVGSKASEQVITAYSVIFALVVGIGVLGGALPALALFSVPFVALFIVLFLLFQHHREPAAQARSQARHNLHEAKKDAHKGESLVASLANELRHVKSELTVVSEQHRKAEETIQKRKAKELERHNTKHQSERAQITQEQRAVDLFESDRLGIIQRDSGARISGLQQRIAEVTLSEQSEMNDALQALQKQFISTALHRATLGNADIPGVKAALKYKLDMAGFYTAASISSPHAVQHVHGIGPARAHALWIWRQAVERQARSMMPTKLDGSATQNIRGKYAKLHADLELELDRMWQKNADEINSVRVQVARERERLAVLERQADGSLKAADLAVRDRFAPEFVQAQKELDAASSIAHKAISQIESKLQAARAEAFRLQYRREIMRKDLSAYDPVRFGKYMRRLVAR
ncbi:hypothetical protein HPP05_29125 [Corallococcus exiguus]|uniref:hypothetical protein n=1 Tax=Corallococcus TaxID=83461 RepID=UPI0011C35A8F|nr:MULTISPECIES: hypothetical protein [Corallococcus]NPC73827.1 hypothetical protein [Corallococcus exiguus]